MFIFLLVLMVLVLFVFIALVKYKNIDIWFFSYIKSSFSKKETSKPKHIMFCFVDHFEPQWHKPSYEVECQRVDRWVDSYPKQVANHKDADGVKPQHSFFYPEEEYRKEHLDKIVKICQMGLGEIEIHLHHDKDTPENFTKTLENFVELLHRDHGAFSRNKETGKLAWAFIHGNWTLCNSRKDGKYCGIDEELTLLRDMGCYVDMTLPSAPSDTQTKKINSIYYAKNIQGRSKSHDSGVDVEVGKKPSGDLMILPGPLSLNWARRKFGLLPKIENSDIRRGMEPTNDRVDTWVKTAIHVKNKPDWIFIKIHTHGTQEMDMDTLLGNPCEEMYTYLESKYNDGEKYILHYVTAREAYNIVKAAEAGEEGNPNQYRDYVLDKPPMFMVDKEFMDDKEFTDK